MNPTKHIHTWQCFINIFLITSKTRMHTHMQAHTHTHTSTHAHTYTSTHAHTYTSMHTHKHKHACTHTHTQLMAHNWTHTSKAFRVLRRKDGLWGQIYLMLLKKCVGESRPNPKAKKYTTCSFVISPVSVGLDLFSLLGLLHSTRGS